MDDNIKMTLFHPQYSVATYVTECIKKINIKMTQVSADKIVVVKGKWQISK